MPMFSRSRALVAFFLIAVAIVLGGWRFGRDAEARVRQLLAPTLTATMTAAPTTDVGANGPFVNPGDTLRYTATITNGAAPGAGNDASGVIFTDTLPSTLTLTAGSLHASPVAVDDTFATVGNTLLEVGVAASGAPAVNIPGGVLGNDITPPTTPDTYSILSSQTTSANGGTVAVNANGTFTYLPAVGFTGADTFTYTLKNDAAPTLTSVGTVTVNVGTPKIWYVNSAAAAGGDGRSTAPFNSLTPVNGAGGAGDADGAGDTIYMFNGNYTTGIILENNQQLIGNGVALVVTINANPVTLRVAGTRPTITSAATVGVLLANTNTLSGFNVGNTGTVDVTGNGFGTLTANNIDITGTGRAIDLQNGAVAATFDSLTSTSGAGGAGVNLSAVTGTLTVTGSTSVTGAGTQGINIAGSGLTADFGTSTTVATPGSQGILVGTTTGAVSFGNTTITGGTDGVSFQNNSSGTRTFGTLTVSGGTGNAFLHGAGGGSVTVNGLATLSTAAPNVIDIANHSTGTINFAGGATLTKTAAGNSGVNINTSNGSVTFGGTLTIGTSGSRFPSSAVTITGGTGTYSLGTVSIFTGSLVPGIDATNADGTLNVTAGTVDVGAAAAIRIAGPAGITTLGMTLDTVNSTGGTSGVSVSNAGGSMVINSGALAGATSDEFFVGSGTANVTYSGTIASGSAHSVNVVGHTGGTVTFGGLVTDTATGISLASNPGTTINFTGGINASTGTNAAFTATGGGTVTATQNNNTIVNTLATTTGQPLNVSNTTIGAAGLTFRSISSNGGTNNGITLNTTGAGNFTVTGNASTNSGGIIQNKAGADGNVAQGIGIYLNAVGGAVSLARMDIEGCQNYGVRGIGVSGGFTLDNSTVGTTTKNGTNATNDAEPVTLVPGEMSLRFTNLTGTANFTNDSFDNGFARTVFIHNSTAASTLNLNVTNTTLRESLNSANGGDPSGGTSDAMFLQTINSATINLTMSGSHVTAYRQFGILFDGRDTSTITADIGTCDFSNNNTGNVNASAALNIGGGGGTATDVLVKYNVHNNTFRHGSGAVTPSNGGAQIVSGGVSGGVKVEGKILNNTFGVTGVAFSGAGNAADVLRLFASGNNAATTRVTGSTHTRYLVQGNTIQRYGEVGIQFNARQGNSTIDATVLGNIIREPGTAAQGAFAAIWVNSGALAADTNQVNIGIGSATVAADKNTMQDSDPLNTDDVFLDNKSCGGCTATLNLYQNGSDAAGATTEAKARDVLVDDNNPTLDLLAGFTDASTIVFVAGLPPQPSIAPPPIGPDDAKLILDTPDLVGGAAEMAVVRDITPELGDVAELTVDRVADSPTAFQPEGKGLLATLSEMISPTTYAQDRNNSDAKDSPLSGETITVNGGTPAGFTLPAGKSMTIVFDAQIAPVGVIPANAFAISNQGSIQGSNFATFQTDGDTGTAGVQPTVTVVVEPDTITETFNPSSPFLGQQSTLTFTIQDANPATPATAVTFTDVFPTTPGAMTVGSPVTTTNTCGGTLQNSSGGPLTAGDPGIKLVGGTLAANNGTCTVSVKVATSAAGTYTNTSSPISSFEEAIGLSSTAQLHVSVLTAAGVTISGRVIYGEGAGIRNAEVTLTDSTGTTRTAVTGLRGSYRFDDVPSGQTYTLGVKSRRFHFTPQIITVTDELTGLDLIAEPYQ